MEESEEIMPPLGAFLALFLILLGIAGIWWSLGRFSYIAAKEFFDHHAHADNIFDDCKICDMMGPLAFITMWVMVIYWAIIYRVWKVIKRIIMAIKVAWREAKKEVERKEREKEQEWDK